MDTDTLLLMAAVVGGVYLLSRRGGGVTKTGGGNVPWYMQPEIKREDIPPEYRSAFDKAVYDRLGRRIPDIDYRLKPEFGRIYPYRDKSGKLHDVGIDPRSGKPAYVTWTPIE